MLYYVYFCYDDFFRLESDLSLLMLLLLFLSCDWRALDDMDYSRMLEDLTNLSSATRSPGDLFIADPRLETARGLVGVRSIGELVYSVW